MTRKQFREPWHGLDSMTPKQLFHLNERLDNYQERPRNMSEPRKRYIGSPDARPEALEKMDPPVREHFIEQLESGGQIQGFLAYDVAAYRTQKQQLEDFVAYRKKFEQYQKLKSEEPVKEEDK